jgi:GTP-binding protein HflX
MGQEWDLGKKGKKGIKAKKEYAVLVGIITLHQNEVQVTEYLDELEFLALTAGAKTKKRYTQKLDAPDQRTFVGKGKLQEIAEYVQANEEVSMVIFDDDLSGKQVSNLEEALKVKILDRSMLILDIFAERAQTAQAKTQVDLAQMQYMLQD